MTRGAATIAALDIDLSAAVLRSGLKPQDAVCVVHIETLRVGVMHRDELAELLVQEGPARTPAREQARQAFLAELRQPAAEGSFWAVAHAGPALIPQLQQRPLRLRSHAAS